MLSIQFTNQKQVEQAIDAVMPSLEREMTSALDRGLKAALEHSQNRVPVRSGDLKSTGRVTKAKRVKDTLRAEIGYGGTAKSGLDVRYAIEAHELPNSSGRKYLSSALERADIPGELDRGMARALGL